MSLRLTPVERAVILAFRPVTDARTVAAAMLLCTSDPRDKPWYNSVRALYTQDDGKTLHVDTRSAIVLLLMLDLIK